MFTCSFFHQLDINLQSYSIQCSCWRRHMSGIEWRCFSMSSSYMHTFKISSCRLFSQTMHAFVLAVDYIGSSLAPLLPNMLLQKLRMSNYFFSDSSQGNFITRCWMFIQPNQPTEETATVTSRARFAEAAQNSHSSGRSGSGSNGNNRQQWQTMSRSKAVAARMQTLTSQEKTPKVKARELSTQKRYEKVARATVLAVSTATTLRRNQAGIGTKWTEKAEWQKLWKTSW